MSADKQYIRNQREIRKRKKKMRAYICMGILVTACIFSFWLGKSVGELEGRAEVQSGSVIVDEDANGVMMNAESMEGEQEKPKEQTSVNLESQESVGAHENPEMEAESTNEAVDEKPGEEEYESLESDPWEDFDKSKIVLINKSNKLPDDYEVTLKRLPDGTNRAAEEAYEPLCNMLKDARKAGINLEICSSYRSVERQKELFEEDMAYFVREGYSYLEAYDEAAKDTMPPGYSEHSTGLAFDIVALDYQMLDSKQEKTEENRWLREHCAEYGFILRYPKCKEDITGITYESWHFRYVGAEVAQYIMEEGITLEEFLIK